MAIRAFWDTKYIKCAAFLCAHVDVRPERVSLLAFSPNVIESERLACSGCSFVFPPCPMWLTLSSWRQCSGTRCPFTVPVSSSLRRGSVLAAKDAETQGLPSWARTGVYLFPIQVIPFQRNRLTYPILHSDFSPVAAFLLDLDDQKSVAHGLL